MGKNLLKETLCTVAKGLYEFLFVRKDTIGQLIDDIFIFRWQFFTLNSFFFGLGLKDLRTGSSSLGTKQLMKS